MTRRAILTIDVGTSSTKTVLWSEQGEELAAASAPYALDRPDPLWAEIDGEVWWQAVVQTIQQATARAGGDRLEIAAIGVDAVGWTLIPVDQAGDPLAPAMIWLDRRAGEEAAWLQGLPEAGRLVDLAANPLDPAYITPKLVWLRRHRPAIFEAAHQFLAATGFIVARLTGAFTCDYTQAYGYHFFDLAHERWDETAAAAVGVPLEKMPRLCSPTEIAGTLTARAAAATGLPAGVPVIAGCLDAAAGALGAGVTRPGQTNEQGGQAGGVGISLDRIVVSPG